MAAQVSGTDLVVALYDENVSYGVPPLTPFNGRIGYMSKCGVSAERGLIESPVITGGRAVRRVGIGNTNVGGNIETTIAPETIGFWLKHLLSAPVTTGSASPYSHLFKIGRLPIGFTIEKDYSLGVPGKVEQFTGCRISSAEFNFSQEAFATLSMNVIGKNHSIVAAALDSTLDDTGHTGFSGFEGRVSLNGTNLAGVVGMRISVDNSMPGGPFCFASADDPAGVRSGNPEGRCKVYGTLDLVFQDFTILALAKAQTGVAIAVNYFRGTGLGTVGNEKIIFNIQNALLHYKSPPLETESGMMLSVDFRAFAHASQDFGGFSVTLLNAVPGASI